MKSSLFNGGESSDHGETSSSKRFPFPRRPETYWLLRAKKPERGEQEVSGADGRKRDRGVVVNKSLMTAEPAEAGDWQLKIKIKSMVE